MNNPRPSANGFWANRLPEISGILWLLLLAGAVWTHTHASLQPPVFDAITYYQKAHNFWIAVDAGKWINPLNIDPSFRPPGTILMSYPFGFNMDPRPFYFRSIYFPAFLLFAAVCVAAYDGAGDAGARWRAILMAALFTSMTLAFHFEYGANGGFWGLVDSFLAGLAALAGACVWRGTNRAANNLGWAFAVCLFSVLAILVKPSGTAVAAIAGLAWIAFSGATLVAHRRSGDWRKDAARRLIFRLLLGAVIIAVGDALIVAAGLNSDYLSPQNFGYGLGSAALLRLMPFSISWIWPMINGCIGRGLVYWTVLAVLIFLIALFSKRSVLTARHFTAVFFFAGTVLFGIWFWFIGSGGATQPRYAVPFFMMGLVWLSPVFQRSWGVVPALPRLAAAAVMIGTVVNLALLLLVPRPALAWQDFSGVGITNDFPPATLSAFKQFVAAPSARVRGIYVFSFDINDGVLDSVNAQSRLLYPDRPILVVHRPIDWQRSATVRLAEVAPADALMVAPPQCAAQAPKGSFVANLAEEQGAFTCWADGLGAADGVTVFLATPGVRILVVADPAKFQASLARMVAAHSWDATFTKANFGPHPD